MNTVKLEKIVLGCFLALALGYFLAAQALPEDTTGMGPAYFPRILAVLLAVLSGIKLIQLSIAQRGERGSETFRIGNLKGVLCTLGALALFLLLWTTVGFFYPLSALLVFLLCMAYTPARKRRQPKLILIALTLSVSFAVAVYLLFGIGMGARF